MTRAKRGSEPLRYFHRISDAEFESLTNLNKTWAWIMEHFAQPKWCGYPEALGGMMGCWSLVGRMVTGEDYCRGCDLHIRSKRK